MKHRISWLLGHHIGNDLLEDGLNLFLHVVNLQVLLRLIQLSVVQLVLDLADDCIADRNHATAKHSVLEHYRLVLGKVVRFLFDRFDPHESLLSVWAVFGRDDFLDWQLRWFFIWELLFGYQLRFINATIRDHWSHNLARRIRLANLRCHTCGCAWKITRWVLSCRAQQGFFKLYDRARLDFVQLLHF